MSTTIDIRGMNCEGCENTVEDALRGVPGVESASADRSDETATVEGDADEQALVQAVEEAGYEADPGAA